MSNPEQHSPLHLTSHEKPAFYIAYRVVDGDELTANLEDIATQMARVASNGFGAGKEVRVESMMNRLQHEPYVVLAEEGSEVIGFQFQSIHETVSERYLYYARAISKNHQRKGIAQQLLRISIDHYQPSIVGARSQNPGEILSFIHALRKRGIEAVYPFSLTATDQDVRPTLHEFLTQVGFADITDLESGVIKNSYREGKLGDYEINIHNPEVMQIENYLQQIGFERHKGDALFYFARVGSGRQLKEKEQTNHE